MKSLLIVIAAIAHLTCTAQEHRPEIHCKHWIGGYPFGAPQSNDMIIRDIYALSNNDDTKFADWVAYRLDPEIISGNTKTRNWSADPWLDAEETLEPTPDHGDYLDANAKLKVDRGHQAPLGSFDGSPYWSETNYLSNITPQKANLNQGVWVKLENKVRELVKKHGFVYVTTGPLYEKNMEPLPNADEKHTVPSGYWKIVLIENDNGYIEPLAFIFDQETPRNSSLKSHLVTIDEIESRSNLDFLWMLKDSKENAIEKNKNEDWFDLNLN